MFQIASRQLDRSRGSIDLQVQLGLAQQLSLLLRPHLLINVMQLGTLDCDEASTSDVPTVPPSASGPATSAGRGNPQLTSPTTFITPKSTGFIVAMFYHGLHRRLNEPGHNHIGSRPDDATSRW